MSKMKHTILRNFMKKKNVRKDHILKDCLLVIEGDSFFRGSCSYKDSGCQFILGGEFDRYADRVKKTLAGFIESNVTCYVIFNGAMKADVEKKKEIHQKLIDDKICMVPGGDKYYEPVFVKDVQKQVLEELGIRYFVCEYDALKTVLDVSKEHNCPVLTNNIEYCLFGVSCITPNSIAFDKKSKQVSCKIQTPEDFQSHFTLFENKKPLFFTLLDENGPLFEKIPEIIGLKPNNPVEPVLQWVTKKRREEAMNDIAKKLATDKEREEFNKSVNDLRKLIFYQRDSLGMKYFKTESTESTTALLSNDKGWFAKGVMSGRIAIPYINLKNYATFSGSLVICDKNREDAMLPAMDIVIYAYNLLTGSQKGGITFVGRKLDKSYHEEIASDLPSDVSLDGLFENKHQQKQRGRNKKKQVAPDSKKPDLFKNFIDRVLQGFDWSLLKDVPEDCWLLIISLVYYISKTDVDFVPAAYSILLSYTMLGPVSDKVGLIKRSDLNMSHSLNKGDGGMCTHEDCLKASHAVIDYFYEVNIKKTFDRSVLHSLAEFQHCLQQMNYLNKLCGEVKCTNYYKTYNGTFVFNVLLRLRECRDPMVFVETHLKKSPSVLQLYKDVKEVFDNCLSAVEKKVEKTWDE